MKQTNYNAIDEVVYQEILPNGLKVFLIPKNQFNKTYALFTTNFGAVDTEFTPLGQDQVKTYPAGIAHFLEHKLFETEHGDAFDDFSAIGASSNAYTSFTQTAYLFSATKNVLEAMGILLDFVQDPYFTEASVAKEQEIIAQEIQMYQDDPDWQLFSGMLKALYPDSPLADDIAGTVESIREITPEMLYENHHTFYHPANMTMLVVGKMDVEAMMATIRENQAAKSFDAAHPIDSVPFESGPSQAQVTLTAEVATPKLALGYRGGDKLPESGREKMRYKIANYVAVAMLFGPTSQWYQEHYETGVIDDSFSFEFSLFNSFHFANFMAETDDPHGLAQEIKAHFQEYETAADLNDDHLALQMKEIIGDFYQRLNSVTYIASQFSTSLYDDVLYFDMLDVISDLTVDDLKAYVASFLAQAQVSEVVMFPTQD